MYYHENDTMSIFQHPVLLVVFSFLLCPVASQKGQGVYEVKSGRCTSAEWIATAADCQATLKVFGLAGTVSTGFARGAPPRCSWINGSGVFNTNTASTTACGDGTTPNYMCLCVEPCPIGNYQNEESSATCNSCLPGTYNDEIGKALCKGCRAGTYSGETGRATCKSCLPGTYNDETGRSFCQSCTIGKYSNEIGESTCRNCPAGKNSATGASNCTICCHAKANYSKYEKDCNTITDATACFLIQFDPLVYTCDWNCNAVDMHNVPQKYLRD